MTDMITLFLSFFFLILGASRGFLLSLLVPFSIILATIIGILYYQLTKNVIVSVAIGLCGPFLLNLLFKYLLKMILKATNSEIKPSFLSRLGGAFLTLVWGWVFIVFALLLIAVMPVWGNVMPSVHNDVTKSASYFFAKPFGEYIFNTPKQTASPVTSDTPSADAKSLAEDPRFQKTLEDPEIQKEIDAHDFVHLMSNPKIIDLTQQIMSDPATLKKVMAIYSSQTQPQQQTQSQ